jgi:hypothetical protein
MRRGQKSYGPGDFLGLSKALHRNLRHDRLRNSLMASFGSPVLPMIGVTIEAVLQVFGLQIWTRSSIFSTQNAERRKWFQTPRKGTDRN